MRVVASILLLASGLTSSEKYLTVQDVFVNGQGPFRFLVDTGAQSSAIADALARRLNLVPQYRVEQVTATGTLLTAAAIVELMQVGSASVARTELLIGGMSAAHGVDGILGQSFLSRVNYILNYKLRRIQFEPDVASLRGDKVPFDTTDDCPEVEAEIRGMKRKLILDSGAPALILFDNAPSPSRLGTAFVQTNAGSETASVGREQVRLGAGRSRQIGAVYLPGRSSGRPGLLPPSAFRWVYINNNERYAMFSPD